MINYDRFWWLLSKKVAKEASIREEEELQKIINIHDELHEAYVKFMEYWDVKETSVTLDLDRAYEKTLSNIEESQEIVSTVGRLKNIKVWTAMAASLLLLVVSGFLMFINSSDFKNTLGLIKKQNDKGMRSEILLPDGSIVWLNAESELKFPEKFDKDSREIYLTGEAFFEISRDESRPFIIHMDKNHIRVLGTSFNVKAYDEEDLVETTVVTGKVAFIRNGLRATKDFNDTLFLTPNYKVLYSKETGKLTKTTANTHEATAWKEGKLIFKSNSFSTISRALERTYGKRIIFDNERIGNCKLTGTFENNSLEEIMILITKTNDYTYEITDETLTIFGEGCL